MLQQRPFQNIKTDGNEFKMFYKKCNMSRDMTTQTKWVCAQRRLKSAWASAQCGQRRLWSDYWAGVQADHSLRWAHSHFVGFVMSRLIYWLIHTDFQIHEIFPSRLANPINKLVLRIRLFIGFATLLRNNSCIWKSMWLNLYIQELWTYGSGTLRVVHCWLIFIWSLWKYLEKF